MKRLFINELNNMRDLGGYTTLNGTTTKYMPSDMSAAIEAI